MGETTDERRCRVCLCARGLDERTETAKKNIIKAGAGLDYYLAWHRHPSALLRRWVCEPSNAQLSKWLAWRDSNTGLAGHDDRFACQSSITKRWPHTHTQTLESTHDRTKSTIEDVPFKWPWGAGAGVKSTRNFNFFSPSPPNFRYCERWKYEKRKKLPQKQTKQNRQPVRFHIATEIQARWRRTAAQIEFRALPCWCGLVWPRPCWFFLCFVFLSKIPPCDCLVAPVHQSRINRIKIHSLSRMPFHSNLKFRIWVRR